MAGHSLQMYSEHCLSIEGYYMYMPSKYSPIGIRVYHKGNDERCIKAKLFTFTDSLKTCQFHWHLA